MARTPSSRSDRGPDDPRSTPLIEAGRVGRPHGLDGSFHVTRPDARAARGARRDLRARACSRRIERRAGTAERPILRLAGHAGREAAEALRGAPLAVPRRRAPPLEAGEYWAHELEGCAVYDGERRVGEVRRMLPLPSCEALEVAREDGGDLLVPMVRDAIRSVDVARPPHRRRPGVPGRAEPRADRRLHAVPAVVRLVPRPAPRRQRDRARLRAGVRRLPRAHAAVGRAGRRHAVRRRRRHGAARRRGRGRAARALRRGSRRGARAPPRGRA